MAQSAHPIPIIIREAFQHNKGIIERGLEKKLSELSSRYTEGGILCGAHLCGPYAVINFFQNGAIARDENETTISTNNDY